MSQMIKLPGGEICWMVAGLQSIAGTVEHALTHVSRPRGTRPAGGSTRWEQRYADSTAWVEWDWAEVSDGTIVQADPLNIRSNVLLLDDNRRPLLSSRRRVTLATLVYLLPWQGHVLDTLRLEEQPQRLVHAHAHRLAA